MKTVITTDAPHIATALDDAVFARFRELIYREAGIALTDMKKALLVGRLAGRVRELGLPSFESCYAIVSRPAGADERKLMLDRICTNGSSSSATAGSSSSSTSACSHCSRRAPTPDSRAGCAPEHRVLHRRRTLFAGHVAARALSPETGWQVEVAATDLSTRCCGRRRPRCG
jgi:chemotaxis protein methyltransferase CheR